MLKNGQLGQSYGQLFASHPATAVHAGADLGGGVVTSHPPPGAAAYFTLLLCV